MNKLSTLVVIASIIAAAFLVKFGLQRYRLASTTHPYHLENVKASTAEEKILLGKKIDINSATKDELIVLPGIGPAIAARIVAERPFSSIDDLTRVGGIGRETLKKIRPWIITTPQLPTHN